MRCIFCALWQIQLLFCLILRYKVRDSKVDLVEFSFQLDSILCGYLGQTSFGYSGFIEWTFILTVLSKNIYFLKWLCRAGEMSFKITSSYQILKAFSPGLILNQYLFTHKLKIKLFYCKTCFCYGRKSH